MNILICAGGSGWRQLEATLHLCAAGLGPESLHLVVIDPDGSNGNGERVKALVRAYQNCRRILKGADSGVPWFRTGIDFIRPGAGDDLPVWNPVPRGLRNLKSLLRLDECSEDASAVARLFFTEDELCEDLKEGFRGHPAIGAAAMAEWLARKAQPWDRLLPMAKQELETNKCRIFLAASVFGGTGASAIHPIARFLRSQLPAPKNQLSIGLAALVPYFSFAPNAQEDQKFKLAAKAEHFALATKSAVRFYDLLRKNEDWPFDAVYWMGDANLVKLKFTPGGPTQSNPAHFVELMAAMAGLDYFAAPEMDGACHYSGANQDPKNPRAERTLLDWPDLPCRGDRQEVQQRLLEFLLGGIVHTTFYEPVLNAGEHSQLCECVPWYRERFAPSARSLKRPGCAQDLAAVSSFFSTFHIPWWTELLDRDRADVRLFNTLALANPDLQAPDPERLLHLLWPDGRDTNLEHFDRMFTDMVRVDKKTMGGSEVAEYFSVLASAVRAFSSREYYKTGK